ncbi:MAG: pseudouridine synthase Rsu [Bacteroidetes bacterium]|nr:pseudouridine synthase Rsu [Bacteroidota bacterium]
MSFRLNIKYYLVHSLGFTNKEAIRAIENRKLKVNGSVIIENIEFDETWEIYLDDKLLKPNTPFTYIALYKPRGIETTNNEAIADNLRTVFKFEKHLGYAGRLDKESEGLLLLSNDGKYIQSLSSPIKDKEKEYIVTVNKPITDEFITEMSRGVDIMICKTKPCVLEKISDFEFRIILTEGKNRQIRRMCKALGYLVARLIRVRIDTIHLGDLKPGEFREYKI